MALREGRCACAHVRYRLLADPLFVHCCHCLNCQRQTGSAFVVNALVEASRIELLSGSPVGGWSKQSSQAPSSASEGPAAPSAIAAPRIRRRRYIARIMPKRG